MSTLTHTLSLTRVTVSGKPDITPLYSYSKRKVISMSIRGKRVEETVASFTNEMMKIGRPGMLVLEENRDYFKLNEDGSQRILEDGL